MNRKFNSLDDVLQELTLLASSKQVDTVNWSAYKILHHCSQTIDYSMAGYPQQKPKWFQWTIGKLVFWKFLRQGYMRHGLNAPVPGSPLVQHEGTLAEGIALLRNSINNFKSYKGVYKPHLFFGSLSKQEYDQYFAMHIADHFSELVYS